MVSPAIIAGVDMNDRSNLALYNQLFLFRNNSFREDISFENPSSLEQRALQSLAHSLDLDYEYYKAVRIVRVGRRKRSADNIAIGTSQDFEFLNFNSGEHVSGTHEEAFDHTATACAGDPSTAQSPHWSQHRDSFFPPKLGGVSDYGSSNTSRLREEDIQACTKAPDPLSQWYTRNDGPWIPKGIPDFSNNPPQIDDGLLLSGQDCFPPEPRTSDSIPASSLPANGHINLGNSKTTDKATDAEPTILSVTDEKAPSVLKTLHDLGYPLEVNCSPAAKAGSSMSATRNKNENLVICQVCYKFRGRSYELKKHMERHERPYGCTYSVCNKVFGAKNDWKRHEYSQHVSLSIWLCDEETLDVVQERDQ